MAVEGCLVALMVCRMLRSIAMQSLPTLYSISLSSSKNGALKPCAIELCQRIESRLWDHGPV